MCCGSNCCNLPLHDRLHNNPLSNPDFLHASLFFLVKIKTEQISLILMVVVEVRRELFFPSFIVLIPMPDLQLDDKLLPERIDNDIRALLIPCLRLDIIISCSVDNRPQV